MQMHVNKRGIALVMVLAILSVMTILAVAFVVTMRVERLAAASQVDLVRAWSLADTALARAMKHLDDEIGAIDVVPPWFVKGSTGGGEPAFPQIMDGDASRFLPRTITGSQDYVNALNPAHADRVRWQNVTVGGNTIGRYAFLIADCSGFLDPHHIGDHTRDRGIDTEEIRLHTPPLPPAQRFLEMNENFDFRTSLDGTWKRLESFPEMVYLPGQTAWHGTGFNVSNYFPYSHFPLGYLDTNTPVVRAQRDLSAGLPPLAQIQNILSSAGFTNPYDLAHNIRDYIDADNVPGDPDTFATEAVPMINELALNNTLSVATNAAGHVIYSNRLDVAYELWYPFATENTNDYTVEIRIISGGSSDAAFNPVLDATGAASVGSYSTSWINNRFRVGSTGTVAIVTLTDPALPAPTLPTGLGVEVRIREGSGPTLASGAPVDHIQIMQPSGGWGTGNFDNFPIALPPVGSVVTGIEHREVDDPRINWEWATHWQPPTAPGGTLGSMNSIVSYMAPGADGDWTMHVANEPMRSVGEFGYLLYDASQPWHTIRLLGPDPDGTALILDRFTVNAETKGFVNLNTPHRAVLAAALIAASDSQYPGAFGATSLGMTDATNLAEQIIIQGETLGPFRNLSDLALIDESVVMNAVGYGTGPAEAARAEALMRNTVGLLRVRQSIYTIIFAAQALAPNGTTVLAERKGVAVVWRDPYPDANGRHPSFVQFFQWLDN